MEPTPPVILLDACAVVNLYATRVMPEILRAVRASCAIVDSVEREAQFVYRGEGGVQAREREAVDLRPLTEAGALSVVGDYTEGELLTYIDLSHALDDGEALTAAIAIHRAMTVVTDDRKARRVLAERGMTCAFSLSLVHDWTVTEAVPQERVMDILSDLRRRGNYVPPRSHPLRAWWDQMAALP